MPALLNRSRQLGALREPTPARNRRCNIGRPMTFGRPLHVLALMEAEAVTGPARNLLQFHRTSVLVQTGPVPRVRLMLGLFRRGEPIGTTPLCAAAEMEGIRVFPVVERFRFDAMAIARLRQLVDTVKPDIVQTHGVKSHLLVRLAGIGRRKPWIAFHHGYTRPDAKMAIYNQCDHLSLRAAARVVTPTAAFVGELEARGVAHDRILVVSNAFEIPSGFDAHRVAARDRLRASLRIAPHESLIVCLGRLSREKGHADLVDAIALLCTQRPAIPLRLVVAGDGPERERLLARAARAGVSNAISWLGYVPAAHHLYAAADAAILPSHSEGSPNALLEAAAYRLPIVATAVGGVGETLVHGESGLLVPPRRPEALAAALRNVLIDKGKSAELGRQARRLVETRHDPLARTRLLMSLYAGIAPDASRSRTADDGVASCAS
jgi:glycosyltransferase involved in cell wall biosynthesis